MSPLGAFPVWFLGVSRTRVEEGEKPFLVVSGSGHQASSLRCLTLCMASTVPSRCPSLSVPLAHFAHSLYKLSICSRLEWLNEG